MRLGKRGIICQVAWGLALVITVATRADALDKERYIVRFKHGAGSTVSAKSLSSASSFRVERELPLDNSVVLKLSPEQRAALAFDPSVESIEVDQKIKAFFTPNDPSFSSQGALNGTYGISAPAAWDITGGSTTKLVAVLDSGVDLTHEDLQGSIWSNPGEIASNGVDDDGNGYIDDAQGYDFGSDEGDSDPTDENGHGTHVSGIIAAAGNNGIGVIGVAWNTRIVPVKCLDSAGDGYLSYLVNALDYVARLKEQGYPIAVVNMSLGTEKASAALTRAVQRVAAQGILLVAAAGNGYGENNDEIPSYPANTDSNNVISVAASNSSGTLASFSNYGPTTVDLAAPGANILSTVPLDLKGVSYDQIDGTSMAAPHVSGVAALVAAANPSASASVIKSILLSTVTRRTRLIGKMVTGGIVNARSAVVVGLASKKSYKITGMVRRGTRGVSRAAIVLTRSSGATYRRATTTSASGRFSFYNVPSGTYQLTPSRAGLSFTVKYRRVVVTANKQVSFAAR